jgi:hypothetical protein
MKMKPKQFYIVSIILVFIAISLPLQVMFLYGHHWSETSAIFSKMTGFNWLVVLGLLTVSYLYYHASQLLIIGAPLVLILVTINNYFVGKFAGDFTLTQTSLASVSVGLLFVPLFLPSSQILLKDPKRRWWRISKRVNKRVSATINPYVGEMIHSYTHDISQSGAFVCVDKKDDLPKVGDNVRVILNINSMRKIRCEAIVVRISEASGSYPQGMGIKFIDADKDYLKSYQKIMDS